jgi:hypothetical protein
MRHTAKDVQVRGKTLKPLFLGPSQIPEAGNGLFCSENIKKGELITEYGGEVLSADFVRNRIPEHCRTHLKATGLSGSPVLDGSIHYSWMHEGKVFFDLDYYLSHNMVASFANDPRGSPFKVNVAYYFLSGGFFHPYSFDSNEDGFAVENLAYSRVFLKAKTDIPAGTELFVNYGPHDLAPSGEDCYRGGHPRDLPLPKPYSK